MTLKGVDISNHNRGLDLSILDVDFAIIKATEGIGWTDKSCDGFVQQARRSGKLWGFYHYARNNDPQAEADYFIKETRNYFGEGIPVLDFEAKNESLEKGDAWALPFCERVHEVTGVWPMFYTYQYALTKYTFTEVSKRCALWVAQYPNVYRPGFDFGGQPPKSLGPWPYASAWQFCSDGRLPTWGGDLDLDFFYGTADAWRKIAAGDLSTVNPPNVEKPAAGISTLENNDYIVTVKPK